jgi:hypothetical protein
MTTATLKVPAQRAPELLGQTGRVVAPADVAALAVHLMVNTAITGGTYDIDGGNSSSRERALAAEGADMTTSSSDQTASTLARKP